MIDQPMLERLDHLRANGFKTFIVTHLRREPWSYTHSRREETPFGEREHVGEGVVSGANPTNASAVLYRGTLVGGLR
jgi:hypothetical protein